jgi:hypothetical protein
VEGIKMANTYTALKDKHQKEVNNFPMFFAFNNQQFEEGMAKLGLELSEINKIYKFNGGGYYKKTDAEKLHSMFKNHDEEMKTAMQDEVFVYDMFDYELGNHEYGYTHDITDTLRSLGLTLDEVKNNSLLSNGLRMARDAQEE